MVEKSTTDGCVARGQKDITLSDGGVAVEAWQGSGVSLTHSLACRRTAEESRHTGEEKRTEQNTGEERRGEERSGRRGEGRRTKECAADRCVFQGVIVAQCPSRRETHINIQIISCCISLYLSLSLTHTLYLPVSLSLSLPLSQIQIQKGLYWHDKN